MREAIKEQLELLELDGYDAEFKIRKHGGLWAAAIVEGNTDEMHPLLDMAGDRFLIGMGENIEDAIEILNRKVAIGLLEYQAELIRDENPKGYKALKAASDGLVRLI